MERKIKYIILTVIIVLILVFIISLKLIFLRNKNNINSYVSSLETIKSGEYADKNNKKYVDSNNNVAVIPAGFTVSNLSDETNINSGLVIYEGNISNFDSAKSKNNQFVWIPVQDIDDFVVVKNNSKVDYRGLLYNWDLKGKKVYDWNYNATITGKPSSNSYSEPINLTGKIIFSQDTDINGNKIIKGQYEYDSQEMFFLFGTGTYSDTMYEETFNNMAKSVLKYGGFYIGRYETSINNDTNLPQSIKNVISTDASNQLSLGWYGLYSLQSKYNTNSTQGNMIWGCQWDAMVKWLEKTKINIFDLTKNKNVSINNNLETGIFEQDKLNNIYDLIGNKREFTQEASLIYSYARVARGWNSNIDNWKDSLIMRDSNSPDVMNNYYGSRLSLYIK